MTTSDATEKPPLPGVTQSLALWTRIFTRSHIQFVGTVTIGAPL